MAESEVAKKPRGRPRLNRLAQAGPSVQTLDRALTLLKLLSESDGLSLTDVSQQAGLSAPTAYRLLTTMERHGFATSDEEHGLWRVGVETFRAGSAFSRGIKIVDMGRSVMRQVMHKSGETANIAIAESGDVVFVSQVECHEPIRAFFRPGTRAHMHASGIGKALLASLPDDAVRSILHKKGLPGFTDRTIVKPAALFADLETIRKRGWSLDDEERHRGMRCIAAVIYNHYGEAAAGISISGPTVRMTDSRLAELAGLVKQAADDITNAIGGLPPPLCD